MTLSHRAFLQTMIALASASLGLVAALAWNEAIKATLAMLGLGESLAGLYTYAILATVIAILVLSWLGRLAGGSAARPPSSAKRKVNRGRCRGRPGVPRRALRPSPPR
jgi:hypothetical protein